MNELRTRERPNLTLACRLVRVIPVLLYLFRRIEQRLDVLTLLLLEEAWSYLQYGYSRATPRLVKNHAQKDRNSHNGEAADFRYRQLGDCECCAGELPYQNFCLIQNRQQQAAASPTTESF
jgi:hypothetical protein